MSNFTFTSNSITVSGKTYPAEYSITPSGAVMAFVTTPDAEEPQRVRFAPDHPDHAAALAAAQAEQDAREAEAAQAVQEAAAQAEPEVPTADAAQAAQEPAAEAAQENPGTFPGWTGEIHQGKARAKRIAAAKDLSGELNYLDREKMTAVIEGSYDPKRKKYHPERKEIYEYTVTMKNCTCGDFIHYKMPYKHMYFLAHELGLLDADWNAAEPVQAAQEAPTTDAAQAVQEAPTTDAAQAVQEAPTTDAAQAEQEAPTAQAAPAPVPAKDFIGQTITGNGWRIFFDGEAGRTRVIFDAAPTDAARAALEKAGFYFSSVMNSYNKKLTHKAHRAAVALSGELGALYA